VFDLDNEEISIGKALFNVSKSNIMEIGKGKNAVPDATEARNPVIVAPTASDGGRNENMPFAPGGATLTQGGFLSATHPAKSGAHASAVAWSGLIFGLPAAISTLSLL